MKRFEDLTKEELWKLRNEVSLGSIYISDYRNSFGFKANSMCDFFESFMSYIQGEMEEDGKEDPGNRFFDYLDEYDTPDFLWRWYNCYDSFDWVEYEEEEEEY